MNNRGQARTLDALLALLVVIIGLSVVFRVYEFIRPSADSTLESLAYIALATLDSDGYLARIVYSNNTRLLECFLNAVLPAEYGYNCTVYNESWQRIISVEARGYDLYRARSAVYVLFGYNGTLSIRYVVLSISGG